MEDRKKILILGTIIVLILLLAAIFFIYKIAYKKGVEDQYQSMIFGLAQSAMNCQPIPIELNEGTIQLVNPACYQTEE